MGVHLPRTIERRERSPSLTLLRLRLLGPREGKSESELTQTLNSWGRTLLFGATWILEFPPGAHYCRYFCQCANKKHRRCDANGAQSRGRVMGETLALAAAARRLRNASARDKPASVSLQVRRVRFKGFPNGGRPLRPILRMCKRPQHKTGNHGLKDKMLTEDETKFPHKDCTRICAEKKTWERFPCGSPFVRLLRIFLPKFAHRVCTGICARKKNCESFPWRPPFLGVSENALTKMKGRYKRFPCGSLFVRLLRKFVPQFAHRVCTGIYAGKKCESFPCGPHLLVCFREKVGAF